jgi:hypothetical protein
LGEVFKDLLRRHDVAGYLCSIHHRIIVESPRLQLLTALNIQFELGLIRISDQLPLAKALAAELTSLKVRVNRAGRESIDTFSANQHDDLVFALALASWQAAKDRF